MNWGEPCTRCGRCCRAEVCNVGITAFGEHEPPCKGLLTCDCGQTSCGIVVAEKEAGDQSTIAEALGIGKGCCSIEYEAVDSLEHLQSCEKGVEYKQ